MLSDIEVLNIKVMIEELLHKDDLVLLHILRGVLTGEVRDENGEVNDDGQTEEEGARDIFDNVSEHCLVGTLITDILGETFGLSIKERDTLNKAFWLHDANKKTERRWQQALPVLASNEFGTDIKLKIIDHIERIKLGLMKKKHLKLLAKIDPREYNKYDELAKRPMESVHSNTASISQQDILRQISQMESWENIEAGFSPEVAELMKANVPPTKEGYQKSELKKKIIWFADACLTETSIENIGQRFDNLENHPNPARAALNRSFSESYTSQYGVPLYEVQRSLGLKYEEEFCQRLRATGIPVYPENISEEMVRNLRYKGITPLSIYDWLRIEVSKRLDSKQLPLFITNKKLDFDPGLYEYFRTNFFESAEE